MSQADELRVLRDRVVAAVKAVPPWEDQRQRNPALVHNDCIAAVYEAFAAYINEKPHDEAHCAAHGVTFPKRTNEGAVQQCPLCLIAASTPHAAAEPEKPVAWMYESEHSCAGPFTERRVTFTLDRRAAVPAKHTETPLYASPSAQPIAREPTEAMLAAMAENSIYISGRDRKGDYDRLRIIWLAAYDAALKSAGKE